MGLTMKEKQAVTREMALEYKRATKKRKGEILDSLVGLTEYNRSYAARVLRQRSREVVAWHGPGWWEQGDCGRGPAIAVEEEAPALPGVRKGRARRAAAGVGDL